MRIAVLCTDLGVRVPGTKGASLHLCAIASAFSRLGHDVKLIAVAGPGDPPAGLDCLLFAHPGRGDGIERERRKLRMVDQVLEGAAAGLAAFQPDLLYERLSLFGTAGARLAATTGASHVIEVNALLAEEEARWRGLILADEASSREREVLGRADLRVCVSAEVAASVERVAPGPATIVVPNGVDARLFAEPADRGGARRALDLPPDGQLIGFTGSLRPWHGLDVALAALGHLPGVELVVAGDGPHCAELEEVAAALGVAARVRWLGALGHEQIPTFLGALDVALAPYPRLDGFSFSPLKLFEYLAAGTPVVASDIGQVRTILENGRWGDLVSAGDAHALATAVRRILAEPGPAQQRATAARHHALNAHDWTHRAADILAASPRSRLPLA